MPHAGSTTDHAASCVELIAGRLDPAAGKHHGPDPAAEPIIPGGPDPATGHPQGPIAAAGTPPPVRAVTPEIPAGSTTNTGECSHPQRVAFWVAAVQVRGGRTCRRQRAGANGSDHV